MSSPLFVERPSTTLVRPVGGHLVTPGWASRVVSPLHDVLSERERRAVLAENPDSYLHVTSDPLVLPGPVGDASADSSKARALRRLLDQGAYHCLPEPSIFVYQMREADHEHTGVVAGLGLAGFADGRVLGHERVHDARVTSLIDHYERVPVRSELVTLFHRAEPAVDELTTRVCQEPALLAFTDAGGVEQSVWQAGPEESAALVRHLDGLRFYVADGHHRVAAALRCWDRDGRPEAAAILCAIYSQDQIVLHAFHRRVRGPIAVPELLDGIGAVIDVRPASKPDLARGSIGMYAAKRWHRLTPRCPDNPPGVAGLDVTLLHDHVLRPLLGIQDCDPRLEFLPELRDLEPAMRACDEDGGVLFTLHAPHLDDLMAVADRREVMSAKTTYVKPKPRTGVFLH